MTKEENTKKKEARSNIGPALSLAWELGYTIAIPLVIFALGGRLLDRRFDTSPWFLLAGILLSIIISTYGVYRKTRKIIN